MKGATLEAARAAKERAGEAFEAIGEVVGVGIVSVDDGYGVKVNLARPLDPGASVPAEIEGVPIRIEVVGKITKR